MYSLIRNSIARIIQRDFISNIGFSYRSSTTNISPSNETPKDADNTTKSDSKFPDKTKTTDVKVPWKSNVIEIPVAMSSQYLMENFREHRQGGFYYDHRIIVPEMPEKYTTKPFETRKTGGNHPDTGRKEYRRVGGGLKKTWLWIDTMRQGPKSGPPLVERVIRIVNSDCHTAKAALIGHGNTLRYILATENLKVGDLVKTSGDIPKNPVKASEGDAYPVGALPTGTIVNCVEGYPGQGARYAMNAGTYATIMKRVDDRCILQLPTKHEISILEQCMVTVGRLSNVAHNEFVYGKAGATRLLGIRPKLGLFHKKTSRFGRRPFRARPILVITGEKPEYPNVIKLQHPSIDPYR
ncbi:unnamed protein product [Rotaria socialis]|uniref:Ribosomal protein L2 n=1 Tax=Rotaria socialis TaxID=392032 RepID=A0A818FKK4_9BILA|nr:unnamed protein product [Rotaria socialis]CAF3205317.1 unnamed protein product [Rotaria socialis]CAF3332476.1 unnamed protein product [Rotaria socialis]CAF3477549.1 unnamed protein product [Rotaria socialis]CAF4412343.1 unnamed protein product [Rotaria socialis]